MVKLKNLLMVEKLGYSKQTALKILNRADKCPNCKELGLITYYCSDGISNHCLLCDYVSE